MPTKDELEAENARLRAALDEVEGVPEARFRLYTDGVWDAEEIEPEEAREIEEETARLRKALDDAAERGDDTSEAAAELAAYMHDNTLIEVGAVAAGSTSTRKRVFREAEDDGSFSEVRVRLVAGLSIDDLSRHIAVLYERTTPEGAVNTVAPVYVASTMSDDEVDRLGSRYAAMLNAEYDDEGVTP